MNIGAHMTIATCQAVNMNIWKFKTPLLHCQGLIQGDGWGRECPPTPPPHIVSRATPSLRRGSAVCRYFTMLPDPTTFVGVLPPKGLRTVLPRIHSAAAISQNNHLHCNVPDPLLREGAAHETTPPPPKPSP